MSVTMTQIPKTVEFRTALDQGVRVDPEGGKFAGGVIENFAVISAGPALGHGMWVDEVFISQVAAAFEEHMDGVKARYTHPEQKESLSRGLGRVFLRSSDDGKVKADLHFWKAAHSTPHGNLAGHLLQLAQDDPKAFGASISFSVDIDATLEAEVTNDDGSFHVRLKELRFVDLVDSPAANPDGLFSAADEDQEVRYLLGLTDTKPETCVFGVDHELLADAILRFVTKEHQMKLNLEKTDLELQDEQVAQDQVELEEATEEVEAPEAPEAEEAQEAEAAAEGTEEAPEEAPEDQGHFQPEPEAEGPKGGHFSREELERYIAEFGQADGVEYFMAEVAFEEAQSKQIQKLREENKSLRAQVELAAQTEATPLSGGGNDPQPKGQGLAGKINLR